jgi:3-deoxy-manno-octulosonate cytidylyltransferase (CMP-KDO synthetase)
MSCLAKATVIIPARLASSRLPRKILLRDTGLTLIEHVYRRVRQARQVNNIFFAVDAEEVATVVRDFGGQAILTDPNCPSGTDRIARVAAQIDAELIINVQGDEPRIEPEAIDQLVDLLVAYPEAGMATLRTPIRDRSLYLNPNAVKVVTDRHGKALCFSRAPIPWGRDQEPDWSASPAQVHLHLGIYGYRKEVLLELAQSPQDPWEQLEKLEQLRFLSRGGIMMVGTVPQAFRGVDTPEDYADFVRWYQSQPPSL